MHMCLVECDIYRTAGKIVYVGHYLPDHEIERFQSWLSDFHKKCLSSLTFGDMVNVLSHEPRIRMTRDFVCRHYLPDH